MNWELDANLMAQLSLTSPLDHYELAKELSKNWEERTQIQNSVRRALKTNTDYQQLKRTRTRKRKAPFLREYIKTNCTFNNLAINHAMGKSLPKTLESKVHGLSREISESNTIINGNTWLYYGLGANHQGNQVCINYFLSLTFCPVVAGNHALRKAAVWQGDLDCHFPNKPTVLAVKLMHDTRSLFGNEHEFELIFPQGQVLNVLGV